MTLPVRDKLSGRPHLTVVRGSREPVAADAEARWRRVAHAVLGCTQELVQQLQEQRWGRVDEALRERRELLGWLARMPLDAEGRSCLKALSQAADESESVIAAMMGARRRHQ